MKLDLSQINNLEDLKRIKNEFYSENGELAQLQKSIRNASNEEKKIIGQKIVLLKKEGEDFFIQAATMLEHRELEKKIQEQKLDVTILTKEQGTFHPLELIHQRFAKWFQQNGYVEVNGEEIVSDLYNFERLNIPKNHPARDMQDSLYIDDNQLLRTHNTCVSVQMLEKYKDQAFSVFSFGRVYRNDEDDQTHSHQFTQVDLLSVGNVNFPNLIWTLKSLLSYVLEDEVEIRMRPSFFPFTEPSVEVDVFYNNRWIEILGAGMVNNKLFKLAGYKNETTGFAAGVGIERVAMIKYGIDDIREFYKNDLRFLNQFKK